MHEVPHQICTVLLPMRLRPIYISGTAEEVTFLILIPLCLLLFFFILLFLYMGKCIKFSRFALPDFVPSEEAPDDEAYKKTRGYFGGTYVRDLRFLGLPLCVLGKGHSTKGLGKAWLGKEALYFRKYFSRQPVTIPFGIISSVELGRGMFYGKLIGKPYLRIAWGRKELPMVTGIFIAGGSKLQSLWAQEILRRAKAWRAKDTK